MRNRLGLSFAILLGGGMGESNQKVIKYCKGGERSVKMITHGDDGGWGHDSLKIYKETKKIPKFCGYIFFGGGAKNPFNFCRHLPVS